MFSQKAHLQCIMQSSRARWALRLWVWGSLAASRSSVDIYLPLYHFFFIISIRIERGSRGQDRLNEMVRYSIPPTPVRVSIDRFMRLKKTSPQLCLVRVNSLSTEQKNCV